MNEISFNEKKKLEAVERLTLLEASPLVRAKIMNNWKITKCIVDFDNETVNDNAELTESEIGAVLDFEDKYNCSVYYVIQDEGMWPDGCKFPRYTYLYISGYEEDWKMEKEECIKRCRTISAYIVNMEEPDCSEFAEIGYMVEHGCIINIS